MDLSVQCYNASKLLSTDFKLELDDFFLSLGIHNKAPNHKVFHGFFSGKKSWTTEEAEGNLSFDFPLWSLDKIRDNYTTKTKKIKLLLLETGSKIWIMMEPMSESWHWTHYFLLFPSEEGKKGDVSPVEKGDARCSHVWQESTASAGQDSLKPPAPARRVLMVCQSSLNKCSGNCGEIKARNIFKCILQGTTCRGKMGSD